VWTTVEDKIYLQPRYGPETVSLSAVKLSNGVSAMEDISLLERYLFENKNTFSNCKNILGNEA